MLLLAVSWVQHVVTAAPALCNRFAAEWFAHLPSLQFCSVGDFVKLIQLHCGADCQPGPPETGDEQLATMQIFNKVELPSADSAAHRNVQYSQI